MLALVASAAQATGDPIFRNLKSKPALLSYLCSGSSLEDGSGVARVGLAGLSQEETLEASRYLTYDPAAGGLTLTGGNRVNPITDAPKIMDPASTPDPEEERNKCNARLLEGAAAAAISVGDTTIPAAGSKSAAINFLVSGGVGGSLVANLSSQEQSGAASYLDYANGTLVYENN